MASFIILVLALATLSACLADDDMQVCWRDNYDRGIGTIPDKCNSGYELNGALCYPLCTDGYTGVGPVCWEKCPQGWTDIGAFCTKDGKTMAKKSYGRGVGVIPSCGSQKEDQAGLCYQHCESEFVGEGPVCWRNSSGNANFTVQCNPFAYGHSQDDCESLRKTMKEAGITSIVCIGSLAIYIVTGRIVGSTACKNDIKQVLPKLMHTHAC